MKKYLILGSFLICSFITQAQEYDDIYYNPDKDTQVSGISNKKKTSKSNYVRDFSAMDVDEYNRRGQYYTSPIDTIGGRVENDEDFVYTQQIQKFFNPTIVVDNADILSDVLENSYGNVNIVYDNGLPYFSSVYGWPGYYGNYAWGYPYYWNSYWNWGPSWYSGPTWSFVWGDPYWSIGAQWMWPTFGWNYYPSWSWGPTWGWNSPAYYADYRPNGRRPNNPGTSWASNTRPGGNYNPSSLRPGNSGRPGANLRPAGATNQNTGKIYNDYRRQHNNSNRTNGQAGNSVLNSNQSVTNNSVISGNNRLNSESNKNSYNSGNGNSSGRTHNSNKSTTQYNSNYNNRNTTSTNRSSYNSSRTHSSGNSGAGRSTGGGGRGRHR